jgi:hypothetical protein
MVARPEQKRGVIRGWVSAEEREHDVSNVFSRQPATAGASPDLKAECPLCAKRWGNRPGMPKPDLMDYQIKQLVAYFLSLYK